MSLSSSNPRPGNWATIYPRGKGYSVLAKTSQKLGNQHQEARAYARKNQLQEHAMLFGGVPFRIAADDPAMLLVGDSRRRSLHHPRASECGYPKHERRYARASRKLEMLCSRVDADFADESDIRSAKKQVQALPLGDFRLAIQRLNNVQSAIQSQSRGEAEFEAKHALGAFRREKLALEQRRPGVQQRIDLRTALQAAEEIASNKVTLSSSQLIEIWRQIDAWPFTTSRLLRDFKWLQEASLASRVERDHDKAVALLKRIKWDLCHQGGSGGSGGVRVVKPRRPQNPLRGRCSMPRNGGPSNHHRFLRLQTVC